MIEMPVEHLVIYLIAVMIYLLLLLTSGRLVFLVLSRTSDRDVIEKIEQSALDTGFVVGKCENILIPTLVVLEQYTALGLIFAAKAIVRREDMKKNTLYYLAGTMVNFTYSLLVGVVVYLLLQQL